MKFLNRSSAVAVVGNGGCVEQYAYMTEVERRSCERRGDVGLESRCREDWFNLIHAFCDPA